jgi:hypothetical protein
MAMYNVQLLQNVNNIHKNNEMSNKQEENVPLNTIKANSNPDYINDTKIKNIEESLVKNKEKSNDSIQQERIPQDIDIKNKTKKDLEIIDKILNTDFKQNLGANDKGRQRVFFENVPSQGRNGFPPRNPGTSPNPVWSNYRKFPSGSYNHPFKVSDDEYDQHNEYDINRNYDGNGNDYYSKRTNDNIEQPSSAPSAPPSFYANPNINHNDIHQNNAQNNMHNMQNQYQNSQDYNSNRQNDYEMNFQKLNKQSIDYNSLFSNENEKNSQYISKFPIEGSALRNLRDEKESEKENLSKNVLHNYDNNNNYSYDNGNKNTHHSDYDSSRQVKNMNIENMNYKSKMPTLSSSSVYDRQEYLNKMRQMREFMTQ